MTFIIETNLASNPVWWLVGDGVRGAVSGDWFPSEQAVRNAARRVQQACTAIGP